MGTHSRGGDNLILKAPFISGMAQKRPFSVVEMADHRGADPTEREQSCSKKP